MVKYNPHSPAILGFEWVGIRTESYTARSTEESGYTFALPTSATAVSGAIVIQSVPESRVGDVSDSIFIYRKGEETETGPVQSIIIPVRSVLVSGDGANTIINGSFATLVGSGASIVANPSDNDYFLMTINTNGSSSRLLLFFDVSSYANVLSGKRIVDVSLLYTASALPGGLTTARIAVRRPAPRSDDGAKITYQIGLEGESSGLRTVIHSTSFGRSNPWWSSAGINYYFEYPFRYNELAATDWCVELSFSPETVDGSTPDTAVSYVALQVLYCEETRVGYGASRVTTANFELSNVYSKGIFPIPLKDTSFNNGISLPAGEYAVVTTHRDIEFSIQSTATLILSALRQFYAIPNVDGLNITPTTTVGDTFTSSRSDVILPIALYTSSAVITGTHTYSDQVAGPVYGAVTATQEIDQSEASTAAANYTQVRFYARRFGNTVEPLTITGVDTTNTPNASITPAEFDALAEIIDGWKEVTLRLNTPAVYSSSTAEPDWTWSATSETAGNRWEVLGVSVPFNAVTGTYGTSQVSYDDYESSTVSGTNVNSTWRAPNVATMTVDPAVDFVVILSQDPPAVSGLAVVEQTQELTAIVNDCDVLPDCIPTGLIYHHVSWTVHPNVVCDTFSRVVSNSWDGADTGQTWNTSGGGATSYSVNGTVGIHAHDSVNTRRTSRVNVGVTDAVVVADVTVPVIPTGAPIDLWVTARTQDLNNLYAVSLLLNTNGTTTLSLVERVAGVITTIASFGSVGTNFAGLTWRIALNVEGSQLRGKAWRPSLETEPDWQVSVIDTSLTTGTDAGLMSRLETGNTNTLPVAITWDNFTAIASALVGQTYELQRQDDVDDTWNTIATMTSLCSSSFDDYEARVDVESRYRIRQVNALDFVGSWSAEVANTLTAPGITGTDGSGVLIFTTNEGPTGNLAHTMSWANNVDETFSFPEADTRQLISLYGRDFPVAFRPTERGGERFSRMLLMQASAVPVPSLANVRDLRNLAWADVSYVCVRDELGNRWFANVNVPDSATRRNRTLYFARVDITEVATTPSVVVVSE